MIGILGVLQKRLPHNLDFFPVENGFHGKSESIEYIIAVDMSPIFISLSHSVWENNGLLIKNASGMTLTSQIKVIVRVTFYNSVYISVIFGPTLTKCQPE